MTPGAVVWIAVILGGVQMLAPRSISFAQRDEVAFSLPSANSGQVPAVVVPIDSDQNDISSLFLRLIFLGEIIFFEELLPFDDGSEFPRRQGRAIRLCLDSGAEERFLEEFLSRNYRQFRRYWANRILSGEPGNPPVRCHGEEHLIQCVLESVDCVGIMLWPPADSSLVDVVKPLSIDGTLPGETGYIFR
jgi:hypothetical protein